MDFFTDPVNFLASWLGNLFISWGISPVISNMILLAIGAILMPTLAMFFVVFLIWVERKLLGRIQDRIGPNRVGPWGILQTIPDMLKIFTKEFITPNGADWVPFNLAPIMAVAAVLLLWAVIPFMKTTVGVNLNVGIIYIIAVGGLGTLSFIFAGWGSNNKYALLAAFRAMAQLISYEVPMAIALLIPVIFTGSMGVADIAAAQKIWFIVLSPAGALIFFIAATAEMGRSPFDLLEADSELVAGFNIEYSGLKFGMFYVADFLHAFTIALIFSTLFLGGWRGPWAEQIPILGFFYLGIKTAIIYFLGLLIRGSMPRFRIDQMLNLSWKILTPLSLAIVIVTVLIDKLIPSEQVIIHAAVLIVANGIVLVITDRLIRTFSAKNPPLVVAPEPRPVAKYEDISL
jgi:NADH-quinone oxidoreductase subunit H